MQFYTVADPEKGPVPPSHFKTKLSPKGRKIFFLRPHPPYLRVCMTTPPPAPLI